MQLIDYIEKTNLNSCIEADKAKMLCFYHFKDTGESYFTMSMISELMQKSGFSAPNTSRLKENLLKGRARAFLVVKGSKNKYEFIPTVLQSLEREYGLLWEDTMSIISSSELIDESKFGGKRPYLDRLIMQINCTYANNCFDACAVLLRRLFETLLVLSFQHMGIDDEIKDSSGVYVMLDNIVKKAVNSKTLNLSRVRKEFDTFRKVGNFSAHNITYTASKKDIDDIKLNYRAMLEELYNKAGLIV